MVLQGFRRLDMFSVVFVREEPECGVLHIDQLDMHRPLPQLLWYDTVLVFVGFEREVILKDLHGRKKESFFLVLRIFMAGFVVFVIGLVVVLVDLMVLLSDFVLKMLLYGLLGIEKSAESDGTIVQVSLDGESVSIRRNLVFFFRPVEHWTAARVHILNFKVVLLCFLAVEVVEPDGRDRAGGHIGVFDLDNSSWLSVFVQTFGDFGVGVDVHVHLLDLVILEIFFLI